MKKINRYILKALLLLIVASSCEDFKLGDNFLEKNESTDVTIDDVYSKKEYAEQALANVYRSLPMGLVVNGRLSWLTMESFTDLASIHKSGAQTDYFASYDASTSPGRMMWQLGDVSGRGPISAIRNAWLFISNVDKVPDMTDDEKKVRKAEAKLLIAFHQVQMFRYWGPMPWIDKAFSVEDNFDSERPTLEDFVTKMSAFIDEAAADLPWIQRGENSGRLTRAAALALKTRMLLFAASPLFNADQPYLAGEAAEKKIVWWGNYDKARWKAAFDAGMALVTEMNSKGFYGLVNTGNPRQDFQDGYFRRDNGEVLIESRWWYTWQSNIWQLSQTRYGVCTPTRNLADLYELNDGTKFDWTNADHLANPFFKDGNMRRDVRLYETLVVNQDVYQGRKAETYKGGREFRNSNYVKYTGFGMRKFYQDMKTINGVPFQWPLLRLPEVYLSIAEAANELDNTTDAYKYVNLVRARAGMPGMKTGMSKTEIRDYILDERAREFAYEEIRYFDLMRCKRTDIWAKTYKLDALFIKKESDGSFEYTLGNVTHVRESAKNWNMRNHLMPIPVGEINKKYGLVQNPGW
jgi:hypothetical protein